MCYPVFFCFKLSTRLFKQFHLFRSFNFIMIKTEEAFINQSNAALSDIELPAAKQNSSKLFGKALQSNLSQFADIENVYQRAAALRWKTIENLEKLLIAFEANFKKRGGKVLWARHADDAAKEINDIVSRSGKNIKQVTGNLYTELNLDEFFIRKQYNILRCDDALPADVCIVQAQHIIAEPGAVVIAAHNNLAATALGNSPVVIVLIHIDKMLPNLSDLNLFLPLISSYKSEQQHFTNNKILFGPKDDMDLEGPQQLYVMLIDNGRSNLMADAVMRQANRCIDCGACNHVCPVYQATGTADNDSEHVYTGVIKAIEKPYIDDFDTFHFLSHNTTLCGACTMVCPVKIDLHKFFLHTRKKVITENKQPQREQLFFYLWKQAMLKRDRFGFAKRMQKKLLHENLFEKVWGKKVDMPELSEKSFNEMWKDKLN